ncbi:hypothetical protein ACFL2E_12695, partial [Thermodesulfobacteriota bacterium]
MNPVELFQHFFKLGFLFGCRGHGNFLIGSRWCAFGGERFAFGGAFLTQFAFFGFAFGLGVCSSFFLGVRICLGLGFGICFSFGFRLCFGLGIRFGLGFGICFTANEILQ